MTGTPKVNQFLLSIIDTCMHNYCRIRPLVLRCLVHRQTDRQTDRHPKNITSLKEVMEQNVGIFTCDGGLIVIPLRAKNLLQCG